MSQKDKNISSISNTIQNIERDIETAQGIINGESTKIIVGAKEITVWRPLVIPLHNFLVDYFEQKKEVEYERLKDVLNN